jgi:hypothetical protein
MDKILYMNVWMPANMAAACESLRECAGGRFGAIMGYVPANAKAWMKLPKYDATFISRFSTERLYARRLEALDTITLPMLADGIAKDAMLSTMTAEALEELFVARVTDLRASLLRERADTAAHREGQARTHVTVCEGVRIHLVTEKGEDGLKYPVLAEDGNPIADCIRVHAIEQSRTYAVKGERKHVNSGAPVRLSNIIKGMVNKRSVGFVSYSLRDNFDSLRIGGEVLETEDLYTPSPLAEVDQD